jgi:hypothetical protein
MLASRTLSTVRLADWGSVQAFDAVATAVIAKRIAHALVHRLLGLLAAMERGRGWLSERHSQAKSVNDGDAGTIFGYNNSTSSRTRAALEFEWEPRSRWQWKAVAAQATVVAPVWEGILAAFTRPLAVVAAA